MKLFRLTFYSILLSFALFSCSDDDSPSGGSDTYVRFNANGTDYDFASPSIIQVDGSTTMTINGNDALTNGTITENIQIILPANLSTGSGDVTGGILDPGDYKIIYTSEDLNIDRLAPTTGSINVTSISSEYIEGTFSFSGEQGGTTVTVTNGSFRSITLE